MLETNKYVQYLLIDFSKSFDSADHLIVINKLKALNISDNIIHWVVSFLSISISIYCATTRINQNKNIIL